MKYYKKFCLLLTIMLFFLVPVKVKAAENDYQSVDTFAKYDLTIGGTQEYVLKTSNGEVVYVTISEESSIARIKNGTYKVTFTSPLAWTAGYYVVISENTISSVKSPFYTVYTGLILSDRLVKESTKQASYYLTYQFAGATTAPGVRSVISGNELKVYGI